MSILAPLAHRALLEACIRDDAFQTVDHRPIAQCITMLRSMND